jgi:predicted phosphodiesterase
MRVAVLSDIHGNRHAFEAVLTDVMDSGAEELWCLGDLVGYGAEPDACVELARRHAAICLVGNHDLAVRGDLPLDEFSRGAELAARWTRETIGEANLAYLSQLEPSYLEGPVGLYHASPRDPVWEYVLSTLLVEMCLDVQARRVCLIGHSHVALSFSRLEGEPATGQTRRAGAELDVAEGEWLLNPGSVGQPRSKDTRASYMVVDLALRTVSVHRVAYDADAAFAATRQAGLAPALSFVSGPLRGAIGGGLRALHLDRSVRGLAAYLGL